MAGELGGTLTDAALFFTVEMVAYLIFGPVWGVWSDAPGRGAASSSLGFALSGALYLSFLAVDSIPLLLRCASCRAARRSRAGRPRWRWSSTAPTRRRGAAGRARRRGDDARRRQRRADRRHWSPTPSAPRAPLAVAGGLFLLLALLGLALQDPAASELGRAWARSAAALRSTPRLLLPAGLYAVERFTVGLFVVLFRSSSSVDSAPIRPCAAATSALFLFPFALGQLATYRLTRRFGPLRPLALRHRRLRRRLRRPRAGCRPRSSGPG